MSVPKRVVKKEIREIIYDYDIPTICIGV